jgi:hypothetical protein
MGLGLVREYLDKLYQAAGFAEQWDSAAVSVT